MAALSTYILVQNELSSLFEGFGRFEIVMRYFDQKNDPQQQKDLGKTIDAYLNRHKEDIHRAKDMLGIEHYNYFIDKLKSTSDSCRAEILLYESIID